MSGGMASRRSRLGRVSAAQAPLPRQQQPTQTVQVACPQCQAQNQFSVPYTPDPVTVRCGGCSSEFQVRIPPPPLQDYRICRSCGGVSVYPLPEIGQPFPGVQCTMCNGVTTRPGVVQERDRQNAEMLNTVHQATRGTMGPMVAVQMGGRRREIPLVFLLALRNRQEKSNAADSSDIAALPTQKIADTDHLGEQTSCSICMEEFKDGDELKTLPCLHFYHDHCINAWLKNDNSCPICKTPIGRSGHR